MQQDEMVMVQDKSGVVCARSSWNKRLRMAVLAGMFVAALQMNAAAFTNFITRSGDKLMDGTNELRFISINSPFLAVYADGDRTDPWVMQDMLKSIVQMGGTVTRVYVFSILDNKSGLTNKFFRAGDGLVSLVHYRGDGKYDEDLFSDYDRMLQLAGAQGIRVIIPFIDQQAFWGGPTEFARLQRSSGSGDFYTDPVVIQAFKNFVSHIVNRTNTLTGVPYRDCKVILAWETGNEISQAPDAWSREMSAFIKSIDTNHLTMDGRFFSGTTPTATAVDDPNMDIMDSHIYNGEGDMIGFLRNGRNATKGRKVFIVGEFGYGLNQSDGIDSFLDTVISSGISGAMIWSQRGHSKDGGFYFEGDGTCVYHWPGINSGEIKIMKSLRDHAFQIRGLPVPPRTVPEAPSMLISSTVDAIRWRGSAGAESYDIQRGNSLSGRWKTVGKGVLENQNPYQPFNDTTARKGKPNYYRIIANNAFGSSPPSEPVRIPK